MNRFIQARDRIAEKLGVLDAADRMKLDASLALDFAEHFQYQQVQASAHAAGTITADEAMFLYVALGEIGDERNGGWSADTTTATKVTVTQIIGELLGLQIAERRRAAA